MSRDPARDSASSRSAGGPDPDDPVVPIRGTKAASPAPDSMPLADDGVEAMGGVRGGHSHEENDGQGWHGLDRGADPGHLRSPSQGARPEDVVDATDPTLGPDERPGR